MLPDGVLPLPLIEKQEDLNSQVRDLVIVFSYLLHKFDRDSAKGSLKERIKINKRLFRRRESYEKTININDILFAIDIRNCIVHPETSRRKFSKEQKQRAIKCLRDAIGRFDVSDRLPFEEWIEIFFGEHKCTNGHVIVYDHSWETSWMGQVVECYCNDSKEEIRISGKAARYM